MVWATIEPLKKEVCMAKERKKQEQIDRVDFFNNYLSKIKLVRRS